MNLKTFLQTSYTAYHAVQNGVSMLLEKGFVPFDIDADNAKIGGKYYVVAGDSTLFAFVLGPSPRMMIAESHTDSPCLKVRGTMDSPLGKRIDVEEYGGLLRRSMMDIPCRIAGRVAYKKEGGVGVKIVTSDFEVTIPSLCVHHGGSEVELKVQNDMLPLLGDGDLYAKLCPDLEVLDADLYVVPDVAPYTAGIEGEYLCSPRIDNLTSVYTSLAALSDSQPKGIAVCACFDNEETGSATRQGAASQWFGQVLRCIAKPYGVSVEQALREGLALSIDNGHSIHPAHPEKSDPACTTKLGCGVVIKHNPHYATDAISAGMTKYILQQGGVPYQDFYNHADVRCGSTLGLIAARNLLIPTCDIGLAQLAMHSAVETVGTKDVEAMQKGLAAFFVALVQPQDNGVAIE